MSVQVVSLDLVAYSVTLAWSYEDTHPQLKAAFLHAIGRYVDRLGDNKRLPYADAYYDWWLSNKSISDYVALQRQTQIVFE